MTGAQAVIAARRCGRRIRAHFSPPVYPWTEPNAAYLAALRRAARWQLESDDDCAGVIPNHRLPIVGAVKLALWPLKPMAYGRAWLANSLLASWRHNRKPEDLEAVLQALPRIANAALALVDDCMIGYAVLGWFEESKDDRCARIADAMAAFLLRKSEAAPSGTIPYSDAIPDCRLVDTVGMICPFLARYGRIRNAAAATDLAVAHVTEYTRCGIQRESGLPFHAYSIARSGGLGIAGWARGIGWFLSGVVDCGAELAPVHPLYGDIRESFRGVATAVARYQADSGLWPWGVNIPAARPDTSGTAMIGYAIERAIGIGWLDTTWRRVPEAALCGIASLTTDAT